MTIMLLTFMGACAPVRAGMPSPAPEIAPESQLVVLVHGMGRSSLSMIPLEWVLERAGYEVLNWGYSSICCSIGELGDQLERELQAHPGWATARVHFVGHSLGNIIIRSALAEEEVSRRAGRVVMLAPPNQGSRAADRYAQTLGWLLRPLPELRTRRAAADPAGPLPPAVQVGIIAGARDGKVSVAESHLDGEAAHVVVPGAHTFLMNRGDVHRLTVAFLRDGTFGPLEPPVRPADHAAPAGRP
jgi:hypothetical protein